MKAANRKPHEAPKAMTVPLMILAVLSVIGGFVGIPASLGGGNAIEHWLEPVFEQATMFLPPVLDTGHSTEYLLMVLSVVIAVAGILFARSIYLKKPEKADAFAASFRGLYKLLWNKYFVDEIYDGAVVRPTVKTSEKLLWKGFDVGVIDGIVNGSAALTAWASSQLRKIQVGVAQSYAVVFVIGIIVILGILVLR